LQISQQTGHRAAKKRAEYAESKNLWENSLHTPNARIYRVKGLNSRIFVQGHIGELRPKNTSVHYKREAMQKTSI